ncbi:MAG: hypothetical protein G01um1014107_255 [Parcubacteria group bacterium Gr01-1014_107]|nr:MAG: hypothetical protein G01um1014107_255 [Parcubacteria group bacterium Gr01-1014_107]
MSKIHIIFEGKVLTQSRFNEIERFVLEYFHSLWNDIRNSIYSLRKTNPEFLKSELSLAFIGADSLSRFREIITTGEEEKNNEDRFREWFDAFVFNKRNEAYKKYKQEISCDSSIAWKLRNALLHFYGLPDLKSECVGFATIDQTLIKKFKTSISQNHYGKQVRVVNPYRLIEAIFGGFLIQAEALSEIIRGDSDLEKEKYAKGVVRCYEIIQNEGTVHVHLQKK